MRKWLVLLLAVPAAGLPAAGAQDLSQEIQYSNKRLFSIPFHPGPGKERLKQLRLFVSTDQGRTWEPNAVAAPDQERFRFLCDRDGFYWFTVQTLDKEGRYYPPALEGAQPSLKVVVDTQPPVVQLRALAGQGSGVAVSWEIQDEYLDLKRPDAFHLEYRPVGGVGWITLPADPASAQHAWDPRTSAPLEVRLRVRDRAGNSGEATTNVIAGQQAGGQPFAAPAIGALPAGYPGDVERRLVNSKRISLDYEVKDKGPSGVSAVELWYTQDGRSWGRYPLPRSEDGAEPTHPLVFDVSGEGVYGFTLIAKSGVGLGERPPQIGDRPQVWVEVDLTRPDVQLQGVAVGRGPDKGKLTVRWSARDKNLGGRPISLAYAEKAGGTWTPIAGDLPNTGVYVWKMPEGVPYQFHVRVQARDEAGNVGESVTAELVRVDLALPRAHILKVAPAQ